MNEESCRSRPAGRLIVFGADGEQARAVADALAREPFHNVTYFDGSLDSLQAALN